MGAIAIRPAIANDAPEEKEGTTELEAPERPARLLWPETTPTLPVGTLRAAALAIRGESPRNVATASRDAYAILRVFSDIGTKNRPADPDVAALAGIAVLGAGNRPGLLLHRLIEARDNGTLDKVLWLKDQRRAVLDLAVKFCLRDIAKAQAEPSHESNMSNQR